MTKSGVAMDSPPQRTWGERESDTQQSTGLIVRGVHPRAAIPSSRRRVVYSAGSIDSITIGIELSGEGVYHKTPELRVWGDMENPLVEDLLVPGLRIVFCGTALSAISWEKRAYYANPSNGFWKTIHKHGLVPERIDPADYRRLLEFGIGLTDLCKEQFGQDKDLEIRDAHALALQERIQSFSPRVLAFTSKTAGSMYMKSVHGIHKVDWGKQAITEGRTILFILPSTSGLARNHFTRNEKYWLELAQYAAGLSLQCD
jgi:TDG/mug DNA glycosylase family protein